MRTTALLIALLVASATAVVAQNPRIDGRHLRPANDTFFTLLVSAGRVDTTGWATQTLARSKASRGEVWTQVYRWHGRDGSASLDSLVMGMDLLPLTESRTTDGGSVEVTYAGSHVRASIQPKAGVARTLDTTFASIVY